MRLYGRNGEQATATKTDGTNASGIETTVDSFRSNDDGWGEREEGEEREMRRDLSRKFRLEEKACLLRCFEYRNVFLGRS